MKELKFGISAIQESQCNIASHAISKDNEVYGYGNAGNVQRRQVIGIDVDHWYDFDNLVIENSVVKGFTNGAAGIALLDNTSSVEIKKHTCDNPFLLKFK